MHNRKNQIPYFKNDYTAFGMFRANVLCAFGNSSYGQYMNFDNARGHSKNYFADF